MGWVAAAGDTELYFGVIGAGLGSGVARERITKELVARGLVIGVGGGRAVVVVRGLEGEVNDGGASGAAGADGSPSGEAATQVELGREVGVAVRDDGGGGAVVENGEIVLRGRVQVPKREGGKKFGAAIAVLRFINLRLTVGAPSQFW